MIQLGTSAGNFDPVHSLGTAVLYQALFDLKRNSPPRQAHLRALCDDPTCSPDLRSKRLERWAESTDIWQELIDWIGSPDFHIVVGWSGFAVDGVRKAFDDVLAEFGASKSNNVKRKKKGRKP